ncbi:hypothetical protein GCM10028818_00050 [Spirosoma horti]
MVNVFLRNSMNVSIKDHYRALKETDREAYREFNSQLEKREKLTYFKRSVMGNPKKSLTDVHGSVSFLMIRFLGFTQENFDTNTLPESINIPKHESELAA